MKELVLMRHGLALSAREPGPLADAGRKLSRDGKAQIAASSKRLRELGFSPGIIISSPFLRAVDTADITARHFPAAKRLTEPALASADSVSRILNAITSDAAGEPCVLVVGHQPTLSSLCALLLRSEVLPLSTGGFAYLKLSGGSGNAKLAEFFAPETI
ncbi:MAG: histidine phosphatase family protein [Elusimicrobiales bacterium]|jgi:phosphohistidine phosphatase